DRLHADGRGPAPHLRGRSIEPGEPKEGASAAAGPEPRRALRRGVLRLFPELGLIGTAVELIREGNHIDSRRREAISARGAMRLERGGGGSTPASGTPA